MLFRRMQPLGFAQFVWARRTTHISNGHHQGGCWLASSYFIIDRKSHAEDVMKSSWPISSNKADRPTEPNRQPGSYAHATQWERLAPGTVHAGIHKMNTHTHTHEFPLDSDRCRRLSPLWFFYGNHNMYTHSYHVVYQQHLLSRCVTQLVVPRIHHRRRSMIIAREILAIQLVYDGQRTKSQSSSWWENTHRSKGYSWLFFKKNKKERNDDDEWRW